MFSFFKKKEEIKGDTLLLSIIDMHCTSCSIMIDMALQETNGILSSQTSYSDNSAKVVYDPSSITPQQIQDVILHCGYKTKVVTNT